MALSSSQQWVGSIMTGLILACAEHGNCTVKHSMSESSVTPATRFATTPNRNPDNLSFESSCVPLNWNLADTACRMKGAAVFTLVDVATSLGGHALKKAQADHGTIWIENDLNGTCLVAVSESHTFNMTSCTEQNHYLCTSNTTGSNPDWYIPCPNDSPGKGRDVEVTTPPRCHKETLYTNLSNMMNTVVAGIICATLVRLELILMILGGSHPVSTRRAVLPSAHGSCFPASAAMAKKNCEERSGVLFSIDDLKMAHALRIMELAIQDLGDIWMFTNSASTLERNLDVAGTCLTDVNNNRSCPKGVNCGDLHGCCKSTVTDSTGVNAFTRISCEELRHYVCKINSTGQDFRGNIHRSTATDPVYTGVVTNRNIRNPLLYFTRIRTNEMYIPCMNDTSSSTIAIIIGVVVTVTVVAGFITCCCCLIKCVTKPIKYAVRVQSALYHKNNPGPGVAGGPQTKPQDMLATHVVNLNNM